MSMTGRSPPEYRNHEVRPYTAIYETIGSSYISFFTTRLPYSHRRQQHERQTSKMEQLSDNSARQRQAEIICDHFEITRIYGPISTEPRVTLLMGKLRFFSMNCRRPIAQGASRL